MNLPGADVCPVHSLVKPGENEVDAHINLKVLDVTGHLFTKSQLLCRRGKRTHLIVVILYAIYVEEEKSVVYLD